MNHKASDYAGTYYVKEARDTVADDIKAGLPGELSRGDKIEIVTKGSDEGTAYVTITNATTTLLEDEPFLLSNEFGCLRGDKLPIEAHAMVISRFEEPQTAGTYRAIYGAVIEKDPDSVGAWGADETPPNRNR